MLYNKVKTRIMGFGKWIGGVLGWVTLGPIGALLGFWLGSAVDGMMDRSREYTDNGSAGRRATYSANEQRNSFLVSLLVLSAAVIKADGKTLQSELDYVKDFVRKNFGDAAVQEAMQMLDQLTRQDVNIYSVGPQIAQYMNYSQRLQLFHYLVSLARSDNRVTQEEIDVLGAIASAIGLSSADTDSIMSMFKNDLESAYRVLEIASSATDDEVRKAYKRMALKYHPDKVSTLGEDVQKAAEEKFKNVQEAYEKIKKSRGMS